MNYWVTVIGYLVLVGLGFALWALSRFRSDIVAPLGKLIERLMARRGTRIAIVAIWWWLGWHFFSNVPLASVIS
ncbi:MAG: DUF6186 family protein [Rhodoluna sp.]